MALIRKTTKF